MFEESAWLTKQTCSVCGVEKQKIDFDAPRRSTWVNNVCKVCRNKKNKESKYRSFGKPEGFKQFKWGG